MSTDPLLSICIPTYNRLYYLRELLGSILPQAEVAGVEICVSDNHSEDGTGRFVEDLLKEKISALRYIRQPENIGIDRNMNAAISMARGQYIYPIGDDDMLPAGTLLKILTELKTSCDVLVLAAVHTDSVLKPLRAHLSDVLAGSVINYPDQAFEALWDKMPFGAFLARRECFINKHFSRYAGTSHAYTGAVWEALADMSVKNGTCNVRCMQDATVLLRGAQKTWRHDAARIMLLEIPMWFDLLCENNTYVGVASRIRECYMSRQTRYFTLAHYRANSQLRINNVIKITAACSLSQKLKVVIVSITPVFGLKVAFYLKRKIDLWRFFEK